MLHLSFDILEMMKVLIQVQLIYSGLKGNVCITHVDVFLLILGFSFKIPH